MLNSTLLRSRLLFSRVTSSFSSAATTANGAPRPVKKNAAAQIVEARNKNFDQSPLKMKFLVSLVRGLWVPDALAQLKFSPKHKAVDIGKMIQRAVTLAKLNYQAIPEELIVKEIYVTKGTSRKKIRIMGRGRTGIGVIRKSHVNIKVEKIDCAQIAARQANPVLRAKWLKRQALVESIKENGSSAVISS